MSRAMYGIALGAWSLLAAVAPAQSTGRDWFVRAGAQGDGSRAAPFADPWQALARCEAGDRIHIAGGSYFGWLRSGSWELTQPGVELLGGYDAEFTARDPWQQQTRLCWDATSKNWPKQERLVGTAKDIVIDGLVIDMADQNQYQDEQRSGRTAKPGETAMRFTKPATVRNCVIVNPGARGLDCVAGSLIENNLIVNPLVWGIAVTGAVTGVAPPAATVRHNTVLFAWDTEKPGAGGYGGSALALRGPAKVERNVFAFCDNAAIYQAVAPEYVSLTGNVFFKNRFANLSATVSGTRAVAGDQSMELLEDVGFAEQGGNEVRDAEFAFDAAWLAATGKREREPAPEAPKEEPRWGETRRLPEATGIAPALPLASALALLAPRATGLEAGARVRALPAPSFASAVPVVARTYADRKLLDWHRAPDKVDGQAFAMVVAIGSVANVSQMPAAYAKRELAGVFLYDPDGSGDRITGFYAAGSAVERTCAADAGYYQGNGKPDRLHRVRGVAHAVKSVPKAAFFIESVERVEIAPLAPKARPPGRDWFVRAGAMGGEGSREKPFRDPFQALERCEAGDSIHVAGGDYFGKLKGGRWTIAMPYVALLGGYDAQFTTRAPWAQPTRLYAPPDFQGARNGYVLAGDGDHTGAIVDGFVFDKRHDNVYLTSGALDVARSDKTEHLWLARPECAVRNCLFVNGACGAVRAANGQTFENNVFVNHVTHTVSVERGHSNAPFVFRDNSVLFAWTRRFAFGLGANGSLLRLGTGVRAQVAGNVLAHADNDAIRLETDPADVALTGNLFAHNLWSNVQQMRGYAAVDDLDFAHLPSLGLQACEGNRVGGLELPIDAAWLSAHQAVRRLDKPPAVSVDSAPAPATRNPFDDAAPVAPEPVRAPAGGGNPFDETPPKAETGAGDTFAPRYDSDRALALFVPGAGVGARSRELPVRFTGAARAEVAHDYADVTWEVARSAEAWEKLADQRVRVKIAIQREDHQFLLPGFDAAAHACYLVIGPQGIDGGGQPLRCYVARGTKPQRVFDQAKGTQGGRVLELHVIEGVAKTKRQLVVERAEKAK